MRLLLIGFAILAGLKVWTQDRMYRTIMGNALVQAYQDRARQVCSKEAARPDRKAAANLKFSLPAEVVVGSPHATVAPWDVDNPMWDVRYRHPHLILAGSSDVSCAYDIVVGIATFGER